MSTFNNRSTNALNIHKKFSTLELSKGNDCVSSEWNRSVDGKIKGGVLIFGTIIANNLVNNGNLTVNGNVSVNGKINGKLYGDFVTKDYQYTKTYDGNIKGCFIPKENLVIIDRLNVPNASAIITDYLGNCITNTMGTAVACANNNDLITFVTNSEAQTPRDGIIAKMTPQVNWTTGLGTASGSFQYGYAEGNGFVDGDFAHCEGTLTVASTMCHVENGNNTTQLHGPAYVEGFGNRVTIGASALSPPYVNQDACHVQGVNNILASDTTFNHITGESSNVLSSTCVCVYGYRHTASLCNQVHIEGVLNSAFKLSNSHIEGRNHSAGSISLPITSSAVHLEGEYHVFDQLNVAHFEGSTHTTNYPDKPVYTSVWAGGKNARVNQSYEWVRSSGSINTAGDAQTGIYTLHCNQFNGSGALALGLNAIAPLGTPEGLLVLDDYTHLCEISIVGRTAGGSSVAGDYYSCNLLVVAKRDSGVYTIDYFKINEQASGHFVGKPNLVSVGTTGVTAGTFSCLMDAIPGVSQTIFWAASAISTQLH